MTSLNLPEDPSRSEQYSRRDRESFLSALERLGDVTAAAAEVGITRAAGYRWARSAGISGRKPHPGREEYVRLRAAGTPHRAAAALAGVSVRNASDWDRGIRKSGNRRIYPDGRVIEYTGVMTSVPSAKSVLLAAMQQQLDARYLSLVERETIRDLHSGGASLRSIAAVLGRSPSTISREVTRNSPPGQDEYLPYVAHRLAAERRPRPKDSKLRTHLRLRSYVKEKLGVRWSPEQISQTLIRKYPNDQEMRVSHETIYQALYVQGRGGLRREIVTSLRTGRARRKPHKSGEARRPRFVDPMVMISERPAEVEDRAVPGHWEGDLITGAFNKTAIGTLVERTTRYVMLVHLPIDHTAESVRDGLVATMGSLPAHLRGSLTWDQGVEMAHHSAIRIATDMDIYFCDPASPWQRGSNENTNGLLRQYFPKSTDLSVYGLEDLEHVAQEINGRPRKTLGWDTPAERLAKLLTTT